MDEGSIGHIALHGVSREDAEYVPGHPTLEAGYDDCYDEERYAEVEATVTGRILKKRNGYTSIAMS